MMKESLEIPEFYSFYIVKNCEMVNKRLLIELALKETKGSSKLGGPHFFLFLC